jgi:hypothetical protein
MYERVLSCFCLVCTGNGYGNTALHEACRLANGNTIRSLLQAGADVNIRNHKGSTPLHVFCYGDPTDSHGAHTGSGFQRPSYNHGYCAYLIACVL